MRIVPRLLSLFVLFAALPLHAAISGSVMNADGQAIAAAKISVYGPETLSARRERLVSKTPDRPPLVTATADANGNFRIEPPKDQPIVDLRVDAAGYAPEAIRLQSDDEAGAIILTKAESKSGTVSAGGKGLAGATIIVQGGATFITTTDANGRYTVPDPNKWASRLMILHPDYARVDDILQIAKKGLDRTLESGVKVSGKVVGADGTTGVADAALDVDGWPAGKSGADGSFTVEHLPKTWTEIRAVKGTQIAARANGGALTLKLAKGATITGSVRDIKTQLPLAGADVQVAPGGGGPRFGMGMPILSVQTDAKGNYAIGPLAAGTYTLGPVRPNYTVPNGNVSVAAGQAQSKSFYATQVARVSGVVVDEDKRPVAAARVSAQQAGRGDPMMMIMNGRFNMGGGRTAYSGPDGRFVARVTELDTDVNLHAAKKGWPATKSPIMRLASGERKSGVTLTIPRGLTFAGRVTDKNAKPLSGVMVDASESQDNPFGAQVRRMVLGARGGRDDETVTTASDGTFSMRLKEGKYDVSFKREGYAAKSLRAQQVEANAKPVEVSLDAGVEISGRVVRGGVGVEGVNVNAMSEGGPASTTTSSDGSFTLTDLTPGQMMLLANKPDAMIQEMRPISAPARDVVIEVPAGGRITGHVVDKATHKPVTSFQAGVTTARGGGGMVIMMPPMLKPFTSDDGSFTLENVKPGPTQIVAQAPGFTTGRAPTVEVKDGEAVNDVEIALETGAKLLGRVTDSSGTALAGVTVSEQRGAGAGRMMRFDTADANTTTDPSGDYTLDSLEAGEKTFVFSRSGYVDETKTITVAAGKDNRLDATLGSGVKVGGQVVTEGGAPVSEATVRASSAAGGFSEAHTDGNGAFQLDGLAPGHYNFTATKPGLANGISRDVDIAAQNNIRITMKSGATITGHITGLAAKDLEQTTVTASSPNGNASAPVDSTGSFRIDGAPSGTVRVAARTGGMMMGGARTASPKTIELEAGGAASVDIEFKSDTVIRGRVTRNNQPVPSANVNFMPRQGKTTTNSSAMTDGNGSYEITGVENGPYNVQVMDIKTMAPYTTTYDVNGSGNFDIDMRTASLRGRVLDAATGQPIEGATIDVRPQGSDAGFMALRSAPPTDSNGAFMMDNVARGTYQISADKSGYGHEVKTIVVDETPDAIEFKLSAGDGIVITVVDGRDNRPLGANVSVTDMQGNPLPGDMPFRFGGGAEPIKLPLSAGSYRVTVTAMGYARRTLIVSSPSKQNVALTPGGTLLLRSKSSTLLRGQLIDSNGIVYPVNLFPGPFRILESPGTTTLQNIATGHYRLEVLDLSTDRVIKTLEVDVREGAPANYDI